MTTVSEALRTLSVGLTELAEALDGTDLPALPASAGAAATPEPREAAVAQVLGECPTHQTAWVLKEGGVSSKTGKPYKAFWKCDGKNADGSYCQKKPTLEWVRTHDPEAVAW